MVIAIGIDLGTSNSCLGYFQHESVEIIANAEGNRTTPSVVAYTDRGLVVGQAALNQISSNFENTITDAKRLIGRRFKDIKPEDVKQWPFKVINESGRPSVEVLLKGKKEVFSPDQISAAVLIEMKRMAEEHLNEEVTSAVITVPAYFTDSQREATKNAAKLANLEVLQLINEPTAAAIAYGLKEKLDSDQNILVFDLGGGTFDVSILTVIKGTQEATYEVKAVGGDTNLGGKDFSNKIRDYFVEEIEQKHGVDLSTDKVASSLLLQECEKAKIALSTSTIASVQVDGLYNGINFKSEITRARFEDLNAEFFEETIRIVDKTLSDSKLDKADIQEVVLVGGSTYIPKVQSLLKDYFDGKELNKSVEPDEAVAFGAAVLASSLNPDDDNNESDLVLLDVTPLSLGLEHSGGLFHKIVQRNSTIPLKITCDRFSTSRDNQTSVPIRVYQGERKIAKENSLLGRFTLSNLPKAPARKLIISVTFEVDKNGILKVQAKESSSGHENMITVQANKEGLNNNIEKLLRQAEKFADEDERMVRVLEMLSVKTKVVEKNTPQLFFMNGLSQFDAGDYDAAFENFTLALHHDSKNVEAMKKRAFIHFTRDEIDCCLIECEEILKLGKFKDVRELKENAKKEIASKQPWYKVYGVNENSSKKNIEEKYRKLAKLYSSQAKGNKKKLEVDRRKLDRKMTLLNEAKADYIARLP